MKQLLPFFLVAILAGNMLSSCQKDDDNGNLYGMWQLLSRSERTDSGYAGAENTKEKQIYWSFQLSLMSIRSTVIKNALLTNGILARFKQQGDSLFVTNIYKNIRTQDTLVADSQVSLLREAGILYRNTGFKIEHIDEKKLILSSESFRLTFRKF